MEGLVRKLIISAVLAVLVYAGLLFWADVRSLSGTLASFSWTTFLLALALSSANYLLRFVKWQIYLGRLGLRIARLASFEIFLAGLSMSITPGKFGEMIKAYLLYKAHGTPAARTAPIVIADRLTDLVALLVILSVGTMAFASGWPILLCGIAVVGFVLVAIVVKPVGDALLRCAARLPLVGRRVDAVLCESYGSLQTLCDARTLLTTSLLSVISWSCEAFGFFLVLGGFEGLAPSVFTAFFIYSASTIAGALLLTPGGLGVTEGGMLGMLLAIGPSGISRPAATAATILIRLATLWYGVLVGLVALTTFSIRLKKREKSTCPAS